MKEDWPHVRKWPDTLTWKTGVVLCALTWKIGTDARMGQRGTE